MLIQNYPLKSNFNSRSKRWKKCAFHIETKKSIYFWLPHRSAAPKIQQFPQLPWLHESPLIILSKTKKRFSSNVCDFPSWFNAIFFHQTYYHFHLFCVCAHRMRSGLAYENKTNENSLQKNQQKLTCLKWVLETYPIQWIFYLNNFSFRYFSTTETKRFLFAKYTPMLISLSLYSRKCIHAKLGQSH